VRGTVADSATTTLPANGRAKQKHLFIRIACFALCLPGGAALLAKCYEVLPLRTTVLEICLPSTILLLTLAVVFRKRLPDVAADIGIGAVAGLMGTVAYDLVRVPAVLAGYRVFGTISVFGLWVLDAGHSTRFTEIAGWSVNYYNGITFGIMYALLMRRRHWMWGVVWALLLETIGVVTPFGRIFNIWGNWPVLMIAYVGHLFYGYPLGRAVQRWQDTRTALAEMPRVVRAVLAALALVVLFHPLLTPNAIDADHRARDGAFRVEGIRLNPEWLRIQQGESIQIENPEKSMVNIVVKDRKEPLSIAAGRSERTSFPAAGIFQVYVQTPNRTHSSFVVVEPVKQSGRI
jgi:hypothetical protein